MDDYIRREDASNWLKQYGQDVLLHGKYKFSLMYIWKNIMDLPSADVAPVRHARWIRTESFVNGTVTRIYKCSRCDGVAGVRADNGFWYKSNFCPNCGAKMDGERKE